LQALWTAYGVGHFGKSLMWHGSELLFAFYLTEVCRMAPQVMGLVLASALFASGLMDIAVGHLLRSHARSVPAAAGVHALGACGAGLAFFLFLGIELFFGRQHVFAALAIGLVFRLAYAFYDVPQNAILGLAPGGDRLRAGLSSLRFVCSGLAALAIAGAAALLLTHARQSAAFAALGALVGITAVGSSLRFLWVARSATALRPARDAAATAGRGALVSAGLNRRLARLLGLAFVVSASSVVFMKLEPYFAAYVLTTPAARSTLLAAVACGGIASQPVTFWAAGRWSVPAASRACALAAMAGAAAFLLLGTRGAAWLPAAALLVGFGLQGLGMLLWTAVANATAASAHAPAALAPTMVFGLLTFSQKSASALGTLAIGAILGTRDASIATAGSLLPVVLAMGAAPLACAVIGFVFSRHLAPAVQRPAHK
jgi:Na+/melibiose symporter-like transporter